MSNATKNCKQWTKMLVIFYSCPRMVSVSGMKPNSLRTLVNVSRTYLTQSGSGAITRTNMAAVPKSSSFLLPFKSTFLPIVTMSRAKSGGQQFERPEVLKAKKAHALKCLAFFLTVCVFVKIWGSFPAST